MTVCGFGSDVFVWTPGGYKNHDSIDENDLVGVVNNGVYETVPIESIRKEKYTGKMISISHLKNVSNITVAPDQRAFWFKHGKPKIGTAKEFYYELMAGNVLEIPLYGSEDKMFSVDKHNVELVSVTNETVWGVSNKVGNLILKSDGTPIVFSDCG